MSYEWLNWRQYISPAITERAIPSTAGFTQSLPITTWSYTNTTAHVQKIWFYFATEVERTADAAGSAKIFSQWIEFIGWSFAWIIDMVLINNNWRKLDTFNEAYWSTWALWLNWPIRRSYNMWLEWYVAPWTSVSIWVAAFWQYTWGLDLWWTNTTYNSYCRTTVE